MQTTAAPETSSRVKAPQLVLLAAASLSMAFAVECSGHIIRWLSATNTPVHSLGDTAVVVLQMGSVVLGLSAGLAGAAPAMVAEGHRLFRCMLVGAHLLVAWSIQAGGFLASLPVGAEFMAALCVSSLVGLLGTFAGLAVGMLVFAASWGWRVTHRVGEAKRPTFSLRGMMTATAVAALLLASPRIVTPPVTGAVIMIYDYFNLHPEQPATVIAGNASPGGIPVVSLMFGLILAAMLASAMWLRRSRWGWLGLSIGTIIVGTFAFVGGSVPSPGVAVVLAVSLFVGSLQATLQMRLWEAFGWRLMRIRSGPSGSEPPVFDPLPARE